MDATILDLGLSAAQLNAAIEETATGYIGFAEQGATRSSGYFDALVRALGDRPGCSLAQGALSTAGGQTVRCQAGLSEEAPVLDSESDPSTALIYPDGALVRTDALKASGVRFDDAYGSCRNEIFALQLGCACGKRVHVAAASYQAERLLDDGSKRTLRCARPDWYWQAALPAAQALRGPDGTLPAAAQFGLVYLTMWRFEANIGEDMNMVFADAAETERYLQEVGQVMQQVDDAVLFSRSPRLGWERYKLFFLARLRGDGLRGAGLSGDGLCGSAPATRVDAAPDASDARLLMADSGAEVTTFTEQYLRVQAVRHMPARDGAPAALDMDFCIESLFPADAYSVSFVNRYGGADHAHAAELTPRLGGKCTFFEIEAHSYASFHVRVPLAPKQCEQRISARISCGGAEFTKQIRVWSAWQTHIYWNSRRSHWSIPGHIVRAFDGKIRIDPAGKPKKFVRQLAYLCRLLVDKKVPNYVFKWRLLYWLTRPYFKGKRVWAYYDKGFKGGDNADYAYNYARKQKDGICKVYYIEPDSADGQAMAARGYKTLAPGTTKGVLYALNAEVIYMTHVPAFRKMGISKAHIRYFMDLVDPKCIRMYHGFPLTEDLSFTQPYSDYAGVVIASEYERELYGGPVCGFEPEQIIASGMPRYDGLADNSQHQILFAPTWRPVLHGGESATGASHYNEHFKETKYYERYARILGDERLLDTARRTGYKIKLFLHPRLAVQTPDFEENDVVQPLDCTKDTDYVTIMRESDLMVTDYSSVMYDFAYMRKPLVYYHDPALPYWRTIDFDYSKIGFGEICEDPDKLVETLCAYMENGCELSDCYRGRIERFFVASGREASKRVYEATRRIVG